MARIGPGKEVAFHWALVDTAHASWRGTIESVCRTKHQATCPGHEIGVYVNNDSTQAVIKVTGASREWFDARAWKEAIVRVFGEDDKAALMAMIYSSEWQRPDPAPGGE